MNVSIPRFVPRIGKIFGSSRVCGCVAVWRRRKLNRKRTNFTKQIDAFPWATGAHRPMGKCGEIGWRLRAAALGDARCASETTGATAAAALLGCAEDGRGLFLTRTISKREKREVFCSLRVPLTRRSLRLRGSRYEETTNTCSAPAGRCLLPCTVCNPFTLRESQRRAAKKEGKSLEQRKEHNCDTNYSKNFDSSPNA